MQNKRGMTIVEILVSIALISAILIFLMQLFLNMRTVANQSKTSLEYEMLNANIIKAVGSDIEKYTVYQVEKVDENAVRITFNEYRSTSLSERISKVLKVYEGVNTTYISYAYDATNLTGQERSEAVIREVPPGSILDEDSKVQLIPSTYVIDIDQDIFEIKVPLSTEKGVIYDINIFGIIENDDNIH